jgi:urea transport system permease protein
MTVRKLAVLGRAGLGSLLMALGLWLIVIQPAGAQSFEDAVGTLNAESYDAKARAVDQLASLRDGRAIPILAAMADGRLFVRESDGVLVIGHKEGRHYRLTGALDGQDHGVASSRELDKIKVNNRVRGAIKAALGRLQLQDADPQRRLAAVDDMLRERSPEAAAMLRAALEAESEPQVRAAMPFGVAAMDLAGDDPDKRLAAIDLLAGSLDPQARGCSARSPPTRTRRPRSRRQPSRRSPRSSAIAACWSSSAACTRASRSARSCCSRRSGSPSPSA